ncbi:MAG TPA: hypothetical protein DCZ10_14110 [Pelotomaculum sp.]|nr:hypothetical protein [Pelotomaculum sp.]
MKEVRIIGAAELKGQIGEQSLTSPLLAVACGAALGCLASLTGNLFITVITALSITLILWKPFFGLIGMMFMAPFEELTTFGYSFTLVKVVGVVTFICWLLQVLLKKEKIKTDHFLGVALLFLAWACCSLLWVMNWNKGIAAVATISQLVLLYLMSRNLINSDEKLRVVLVSYVVGAVAAAVIATLGVYEAGFVTRASVSDLQDPNHFARALSVALILTVYLACKYRSHQRMLCFISSFLLAWGVLLSGSRGAWLAVLASAAAAFLYTKNKILKITLVTALGMVVLLFNSPILRAMPPLITERVVSMPELADRGSGRLDIWMVGVEMVKKNWPAGVGINSFITAYNDYIVKTSDEIRDRGVMRDAHNSFLCILAELGLLGLILFCMFWLAAWKSVGALSGEPEKTMGVCMLVYLFFASLTGTEYMNKYFWVGLLVVNMLFLVKGNKPAVEKVVTRKRESGYSYL